MLHVIVTHTGNIRVRKHRYPALVIRWGGKCGKITIAETSRAARRSRHCGVLFVGHELRQSHMGDGVSLEALGALTSTEKKRYTYLISFR